MGEATYYMKARFASDKIARGKLAFISKFILEGQRAYEFWQKHRHEDPIQFWPTFKENFPEVSKYLASGDLLGGDVNNVLAGHLDFGGEDDHATVQGDIIKFAATCWHFAEWDLFTTYIIERFGAFDCKWVSDEYLDPFECIRL